MIHVVRHGRTASNAQGLLLGRANPELDDVGRQQAARVAALIPAGSRVLSSPLTRTRQTAEIIASTISGAAGSSEGTGTQIGTDERWIELDYGEWDQRPLADVPAAEWAQWRADPAFAPPGGESLEQLHARVNAALDELVSQHGNDERDVVVVSHVSPIKAALAWALGVGIEVSWRSFVAPGSVTRIAVTSRGPSLHGFNLT